MDSEDDRTLSSFAHAHEFLDLVSRLVVQTDPSRDEEQQTDPLTKLSKIVSRCSCIIVPSVVRVVAANSLILFESCGGSVA